MREYVSTVLQTLCISNLYLFPNQTNHAKVTPEYIITFSLDGILHKVIPAFLHLSRSKIFYNLTLRLTAEKLTDIRKVSFNIIRRILVLVDIVQVNQVHHHIIKVLDNLDIIFRKPKEISNYRQTAGSCTAYPMNMRLFQNAVFIGILVMQDIGPINEFRTDGRKECFTII